LDRQPVSPGAAASARVECGPRTISLFRFSPALLVFLALVVDFRNASDPDLWGHIRFGQLLLSTGHLAERNTYSYSAPAHLWLHHEWLSEVIFAWLYNHAGLVGIKLLKLACAGGIIAFLAIAAAETGAPAIIQALVMLAMALLLDPMMQTRPQMFDFLFLSATLAMLARDHTRGRAPVWLAIPMLALWANLHGGFFLGIVALAIYSAVVGAQELRATGKLERATRLAAITALSTLATAITFAIPYARQTWYALWHSVTNPMTRYAIADWRPLVSALAGSRHHLAPVVYLGSAVLFFIVAIAAVARWPRAGFLPLDAIGLAMTALGFMAVRNIGVGAIAIGPPLMRHLAVATGALAPGSAEPRGEVAEPMRPKWIFELVLCGFALLFAAITGVFSSRMMVSPPDPEGALAFMQAHDLHGNILNNFGFGQYLIWHAAPGSKIFVDGRYDLAYPPAVMRDYLTFIRNLPGAAAVLTKYPHDYVLIAPDDPAVVVMQGARGWREIYRDPDCILYARRDSAAASIAGIPAIGHPPDPEYFP
jgi:hypothetical protein